MTGDRIPENWNNFLADFLDRELLESLLLKIAELRKTTEIYPPEGKIFNALRSTPPEQVKVLLLGQDPYHEPGQAEGLAFSVPEGVKLPPSLRNIYKEYSADLSRPVPGKGQLANWAANGVLLLNAILTVNAGCAGSHRELGWEKITDAVISAVSRRSEKCVFILWGAFAAKKIPLIDRSKHLVISGAHPSPLSAYRGFFGSRPFSGAQEFLAPWQWPEV